MVLVEMKEAADSRSESFMFQILGYPERVGQAKNVVLLLVIDQSFYEMNGCVTADKNKKIMVVVLTGLDLQSEGKIIVMVACIFLSSFPSECEKKKGSKAYRKA